MPDIDASKATVNHLVLTPQQEAAFVTADAIRAALVQAMATLQTIIDAPDPAGGTLSGAVLSNHVRNQAAAIKSLARIQRRIIRHQLADYAGSD